MRSIQLASFLIAALLVFTSSAEAMMPVIDPVEIAKTLEMINQLKTQYSKLQQQYETTVDQYQRSTGTRRVRCDDHVFRFSWVYGTESGDATQYLVS